MEFRIKSDSLPRTIVKSFLLTVIVILAVFVGYIALLSLLVTVFAVMGAKLPTSLAFLWLLAEGLALIPFEQPLPFSVFLLVLFVIFLFPYFRRNDRLLIDNHGIRFDCRFRPLWSWHIAWEDIQLPITHHASWDLIPKNARSDTLYIRLNRVDDDQPQEKRKWHDFLFIRLGRKRSNNPVFTLSMVNAWEADDKSAEAGEEKPDKRPFIVREIERHLGQNAIKRTFFVPYALAEQARETRRKKRRLQTSVYDYDLDPVAAQGMCIGAFFLFILGLIVHFYWFGDTYLLNSSLTPYIFLAIPITAISLWLLRRYRNAWLTSLIVALVCGGAFMWVLFNSAQLGARLWGQQETRIFVLQAPLPPNPQKNKRSPRLSEQLWKSSERENSTKQLMLKLEISTGLSRQPHQPGDWIELSVRRGLFGQYVLSLKEADAHFRQRLDE